MTAIILGYIGVALMVGLSGMASCIGTSIAGQAAGFFLIKNYLTAGISLMQGAAILGAGLLMGFVCLMSSIYQAKICANGINAIGNGHDVMGKTLILAAFPELYAILTVAAIFLIKALMGPVIA